MGLGHHHAGGHVADRRPAGHAGARHRRRLLIALTIVASFMVLEISVGLWTGSLALLSDAGHMFTDVLGLAMALAAIHVASRATSRRAHRTFGLYRLEVLAALGNAILLGGLACYVLIEAVSRFSSPPEVPSRPMLIVAVTGLAANLVAFWLLRPGAQESLNLRGAYLEVIADLLGSLGVLVAALIIEFTGWRYADPLVAVIVGLFILPRTYRLALSALRILVQAAPPHLDVDAIARDLLAVPGVTGVHDLHVWTLTSGMEVASAHLTVQSEQAVAGVLAAARDTLETGYGIDHATLQVEPVSVGSGTTCCRDVGW